MAYCALTPNVIFPSMPAGRLKGLAMVEQLRRASTRENIRDAVLLLLFAGGIIAWTTGFLSGNTVDRAAVADINKRMETMATQQDVAILKTQIATLTALVSQMQTDLRGAPRADQMAVLDRHLSAQDGRMDSIDTRIRDIEQRIARAEAQVQMIQAASSVSLSGKRN